MFFYIFFPFFIHNKKKLFALVLFHLFLAFPILLQFFYLLSFSSKQKRHSSHEIVRFLWPSKCEEGKTSRSAFVRRFLGRLWRTIGSISGRFSIEHHRGGLLFHHSFAKCYIRRSKTDNDAEAKTQSNVNTISIDIGDN